MRIFGLLIIALLLVGFMFVRPHQTRAQQGQIEGKPYTASTASILAYHRIDEDNYPATSLRLDDFRAQLLELEHGGYTVISLSQLIDSLKTGALLPERSIVITFEGGYLSAYQKAMPLLMEKRMPFTVFYASGNSEDTSNQYLGWKELQSLARSPYVELGILPELYAHLNEFSLEENKRLLNNARIAFRERFKREPDFFSYPFGEHSSAYKNFVETHGFKAAFGLQSGVPYSGMDYFNVPRFTMTDGFGDIDRFRTIANALPVPAYDIEPQNHTLDPAEGAPLFGFSVPENHADMLKTMQCFISGQGAANLNIIGKTRLEIRPVTTLEDDRIRINCTANSGTAQEPKWHWFGMLYTVKNTLPLPLNDERFNSENSPDQSGLLSSNMQPDELPRPQE